MDKKVRQFSYNDLPKRVYAVEEKVKEIEGGGDITVSWGDIEDKPTTFTPTIGTTATTAKAGNYQPTWAQVTSKPATFTPSAHTHVWADITDKPATFAPTIGTSATTAKAGNYQPTWAQVTGKPTTFEPIIGTTATTAKAGNYVPTWAEVTGKPTTFTPSAHTHAWVDITDKPAIIASGATQAEARTAIGAGTGNSNLAIGTTASTAKAGNYTPSATEVVNALNAMTPEQIGEIQTLLGITPA